MKLDIQQLQQQALSVSLYCDNLFLDSALETFDDVMQHLFLVVSLLVQTIYRLLQTKAGPVSCCELSASAPLAAFDQH